MNDDIKKEQQILQQYRNIAVVGASANPDRPSNAVMKYLIESGYSVIPVNPTVDEVLEQKSYPDLLSVTQPVDIVDVFRASDKVMPIVDEAIAIGAKVLWLQESVVNEAAAEKARQAGLFVVMDRCIAKAHAAMTAKKS
ncbi:succinyl-CoA synthetase alpha subunit-like protein [Dehalogenimonas sp. WBC-2]|nr:succinyl-CoA synthetase alpha subunit-like protein [Dehalogenimonas sp. WBC-2]